MGKTVKVNDDAVWLRIKSLKGEERGEQTKLMAFCGLAQNTYNGWNSGDLKSYRKYIDKISEFYGVSADWILTGEEQKEKPATEIGNRQSEIDFIFSQLTPSRQSKLLELARLYLDDQRKSEETQ